MKTITAPDRARRITAALGDVAIAHGRVRRALAALAVAREDENEAAARAYDVGATWPEIGERMERSAPQALRRAARRRA